MLQVGGLHLVAIRLELYFWNPDQSVMIVTYLLSHLVIYMVT
jgi:hypothetical protein